MCVRVGACVWSLVRVRACVCEYCLRVCVCSYVPGLRAGEPGQVPAWPAW